MSADNKVTSLVIKTIKSSDLQDLSKEYAEIGIDSLLDEGLLKNTPIVGTIISATRVGLSINDQIFTKKLLRFLSSLSELSVDERTEMINKLSDEEGYRNRVGEKLIEIISRIDSHAKPEAVAKVFKAFAKGEITTLTLNRLIYAIEVLPHFEFAYLRPYFETPPEDRRKIPDVNLTVFLAAGLVVPLPTMGDTEYKQTDLCKKFIDLELDRS
jgi:hypothetical protein